MAKIDEIKEQISLAKFALGLLVSLVFALTGWMATGYKNIDAGLFIMSALLVIVFIYGSILVLKYILVKIRQLRDL